MLDEYSRRPNCLSGLYFTYNHPLWGDDDKWCLEDLPHSERALIIREKMKGGYTGWVESVLQHMCEVLRTIGDNQGLSGPVIKNQ